MTALFTVEQRRAALTAHPLFASVGRENLGRLVDLADGVSLTAGYVLMSEGDPAGDVYLVLSGRLEAWVMSGKGEHVVVGEIGPGEVIGEMSMLSDQPRAATVSAKRDSTLLRLPRQHFLDTIVGDPGALLSMTQMLVHRLEAANRSRDRRSALTTITVVPSHSPPDIAAFARALVDGLTRGHEAALVDRNVVEARLGPDVADARSANPESRRVTQYLHELELDSDVVVLVADATATPWTERCIRQADRILLIGRGGAGPLTDVETRLLFPPENPPWAPIELVLVHGPGTTPSGTEHWLRSRDVRRHHHVWPNQSAAMPRLIRRVMGEGVGLVLSGGGARGLAHIGVVRAFQEAGIAFDVIGGTSFGSSVAAGVALGYPADRILDIEVEATVNVGSLLDLTFPYMSLAKGRRLTKGIAAALGSFRIEDLPTEYFCVSSDLTAGKLRVHDRGPLAESVRASVAIPGIFPPVRSPEGHVLVDGSIMDNLPVSETRSRLDGGRVVAVDLKTRVDLPSADLPGGGEVSGWPALLRRFNPARPRMDVPRMIDLLTRSTELASADRHDAADVVLRPPVEQFGLLEFGSFARIVEAGYRYTVDAIEGEGVAAFGATQA